MANCIGMDVVDRISEVVAAFSLKKLPANTGKVNGPVHEGSSYRWSIVSTRFKDVTVLLRTSRPLFSRPCLTAIEVYGSTEKRRLQPNVQDLQAFLDKAELIPTS